MSTRSIPLQPVATLVSEEAGARSLPRRRLLRAAALGALAASAWPVLADDTKLLRVGFQKGGGLLGLLKAQGRLEKRFGPLGWTISWHEFPAGPQLLEALNAGSVDVGYTGAPPPIFAQAAEKDLVYIGAEPGGPSTESIVVLPASTLHGVAELKGKRVAVQKGSSSHYLLLAALRKAGLEFTEIQPVYLAPADARAAFESGRVDAWAIWDPYLAAVQATLRVRVLADYGQLLRPNAFYEASRRFVSQYPNETGLLLDELAALGAWATANPALVAEQLAPLVGLPVEVVLVWQQRSRYGVQPMDPATVATQQKVADLFFEHKLIPKKIDVAAAVWRWPKA
jgi:sulfonate transport system substrate-binding protein